MLENSFLGFEMKDKECLQEEFTRWYLVNKHQVC